MIEEVKQILMRDNKTFLLVYGQQGTGKDTLASTLPKDMLVIHCDGSGNDMPYLKLAKAVTQLQHYDYGTHPHTGETITIPYRDVTTHDDKLIRIEYHGSKDFDEPVTGGIIQARIRALHDEDWETVVLGSATALNVEAYHYAKQYLEPNAKDPRKWRGHATDILENIIYAAKRLTTKMNFLLIAHVHVKDVEDSGEIIRTPYLPGRLANTAGGQVSTILRTFTRHEEGGLKYLVQTERDRRFPAKNHWGSDNPCEPTWEALWANFGN